MEKEEVILTVLKEIKPEIKRYFPYIILIIWASSLIFVFLPECYLEKLYLKEWFIVSFIISSVSILVIVFLDRWEIFKINKFIKNLDLSELNILYQYFYKTNINTMRLNENNPTVGGLECKEVILKILAGSNVAYYSINSCYKELLFKHLKKEADRLEKENGI